jgi:hypothetical protein
MSSRARRIAGLVAVTLATGLVNGTAASATAPPEVVSQDAATPAEQAVRFWTPERIKRATDHGDGVDARSQGARSRDSTPDGPFGSVPPAGEGRKAEKVESKQVNLPNTVGRVFFTLPRTDPRDPKNWRYCSATSVQGKHRNLVATSAHCVYDVRRNAFSTNWIFIPSFWDGRNARDGRAPYGVYAARTFNAHEDFVVREDFDHDYAFVNVHNGIKVTGAKAGQRRQIRNVGRLGDNVGGQGFTWNRSTKAKVFSFGYPAGAHRDGDRPYSGRTMKWCHGRTTPMPAAPRYNLQEHVGVRCSFTAGADGGPFLSGYDSATRTGYLIGVNSVAWDTDGNDRYDHMSSPYFNTDTYKVYKAAANRWTGDMR